MLMYRRIRARNAYYKPIKLRILSLLNKLLTRKLIFLMARIGVNPAFGGADERAAAEAVVEGLAALAV